MTDVSTQELFPALGGVGSPVRTGRMAGADRRLPDSERVGLAAPARRRRHGHRDRVQTAQALPGHTLLDEPYLPKEGFLP